MGAPRTDARSWTPDNPPPLVRPGEKTLFTPVPDWLAERTELSWPAKMLYARLVRYAGKRISARPTQAQLARDLGAPKRTLERWISELRTEFSGMPLIWTVQQGDGTPAKYFFPAHPWRRERVIRSASPKMAELNGSAPPKMAELNGRASKDRARAVGDNYNRRQPAARGGASRRGQVFTDRGNTKGQARVAQLLASIGGTK